MAFRTCCPKSYCPLDKFLILWIKYIQGVHTAPFHFLHFFYRIVNIEKRGSKSISTLSLSGRLTQSLHEWKSKIIIIITIRIIRWDWKRGNNIKPPSSVPYYYYSCFNDSLKRINISSSDSFPFLRLEVYSICVDFVCSNPLSVQSRHTAAPSSFLFVVATLLKELASQKS